MWKAWIEIPDCTGCTRLPSASLLQSVGQVVEGRDLNKPPRSAFQHKRSLGLPRSLRTLKLGFNIKGYVGAQSQRWSGGSHHLFVASGLGLDLDVGRLTEMGMRMKTRSPTKSLNTSSSRYLSFPSSSGLCDLAFIFINQGVQREPTRPMLGPHLQLNDCSLMTSICHHLTLHLLSSYFI